MGAFMGPFVGTFGATLKCRRWASTLLASRTAGNHSDRYTLVNGHAIPDDSTALPPDGPAHVVAPTSPHGVFEVAQDRPDLVGAEWQDQHPHPRFREPA